MSEGSAPHKIGVVADDVTGAGDIGGMLALHGFAVRVFAIGGTGAASAADQVDSLVARLSADRTDVAILDTNSRYDPPDLAREKVARATRALAAWGADRFYKKTCSVFRGNVGVELDAMLDEIGEPFAPILAAFPRNGRTTREGIHYVHGKPLAASEFARDPVHPRTESNLVADLARQTRRRVDLVPIHAVRSGDLRDHLDAARSSGAGYALLDAETQKDLTVIARATAGTRGLGGSSALAEELPRFWPAPAPFRPLEGAKWRAQAGALVIAGSIMPQTRAQVQALGEAGAAVIALATKDILADAERAIERAARKAAAELSAGRNVVLRSDNTPDGVAAARDLGAKTGLAPLEVSRAVSSALARAAAAALAASPANRLLVFGGDTAAAVSAHLGIDETIVLDEIEAGLPVSLAPGPPARLVVFKSGSFGGPDFGIRAIERLARF